MALGGGGARAAYHAGVLSAVAHELPDLEVPIFTGISAGAINTAYLANHTGDFRKRAAGLAELWLGLETADVFDARAYPILRRAAAIVSRLVLGSARNAPIQSLIDATPLRRTLRRVLEAHDSVLPGVQENLQSGSLRAVALTTTCYSTGQSVTFFSGRDIAAWERPQRRSVATELGVEHVMASSALPFVFPPVRIGDLHYGDGAIRLVAPFASAVHLGADRVFAVSTRYQRGWEEANQPTFEGPPSASQLIGVLYNAIFLDLLDQDALTMERVNRLIDALPEGKREGLRTVRLLVIRPSQDLGAMANRYEPDLPRPFRFLTRRLGTQRSRSQDFLSTLMFQPEYLRALYELGVRDAESRRQEIHAFLAPRNASEEKRV